MFDSDRHGHVDHSYPDLTAIIVVAGADRVPAVDPVGAANGSSRREDHAEDHHDPEQDEGARPAGQVLQVAPRQRPGHGRRLQVVHSHNLTLTCLSVCLSELKTRCNPALGRFQLSHHSLTTLLD